MRGNRGGILSQAIKVADLFLPKGKILTTWGRHPSSRKEYLAKTNINLIDDIYSSYDKSLNTKYEVKIFNNNIDRIKDYFK